MKYSYKSICNINNEAMSIFITPSHPAISHSKSVTGTPEQGPESGQTTMLTTMSLFGVYIINFEQI